MSNDNYFETVLSNAVKRCEGEYVNTNIKHLFWQLYPFTTENISGYIDIFNLENKSLLTVGSSLDQVLNSILRDVSNVTVMDINPYTKFYYYLKLTSILELSFEEFQDFLRYKRYPGVFNDNKRALNIDTFNRIKDTLRILDYESYLFWDEIIQGYNPIKVRQELFSSDEDQTRVIQNMNLYMNSSKKYYELRKRVLNVPVSFITGDIFDLEISNKYDNIWLSNIGAYLDSRDKLKELLVKYREYLKEDGMLLLSYLYQTPSKEKYNDEWPSIYDLDNLFKEFEEYKLELKDFIGVKGILFERESMRDSVLVYKKSTRNK